MDQVLDVAAFLEARQQPLLEEAEESIRRAHLAHYEAAGAETTELRLWDLFDVVVTACREHRLEAAVSYADSLAAERHAGSYPLSEVQMVINVLEETVWRSITSEVPADLQGYALGLVSTALGAVKDALAQGYLAHIGSHPVRSLRVESLFSGTEG